MSTLLENVTHEKFVDVVFRLLLNRSADEFDLRMNVPELEQGLSQPDFVKRICQSKEFSIRFTEALWGRDPESVSEKELVDGAFIIVLKRAPEPDELVTSVRALRAGLPRYDLVIELVGLPEFENNLTAFISDPVVSQDILGDLSPERFVNLIWSHLFGGPPNPDILEKSLEVMKNGFSQSALLRNLLQESAFENRLAAHQRASQFQWNPEAKWADAIYQIVLTRPMDPDGFKQVRKWLTDGKAKQAIALDLMRSGEFSNLINEKLHTERFLASLARDFISDAAPSTAAPGARQRAIRKLIARARRFPVRGVAYALRKTRIRRILSRVFRQNRSNNLQELSREIEKLAKQVDFLGDQQARIASQLRLEPIRQVMAAQQVKLIKEILEYHTRFDDSQLESLAAGLYFHLIQLTAPEELNRLLARIAGPSARVINSGNGNISKPPAERRDEGKRRLRILYVTGMFPSILHAGGLRIFDILNHLTCGNDVDLYSAIDPLKDIQFVRERNFQEAFRAVRLVAGEMFSVKDLTHWLERRGIDKGAYDAIQFEYLQTIPMILPLKEYAGMVAFTYMEAVSKRNMMDLERDIQESPERAATHLKDFFDSADLEKRATENCDITIAVTQDDADFIASFSDSRPMVIPHGVSEIIMHKTRETPDSASPERPLTVAFLGYYGHYPNLDGIQWYLERIHSKVLSEFPEYCLHIIGAGDLSSVKARYHGDRSVKIVGEVEEIVTPLREAHVCISPLISGAGLRGKINQYTAVGRPTVSTSIGIAGTVFEHGKSVMVGDTPDEFAKGVIILLKDRKCRERLLEEARSILASHYNWESIIPKLEALYDGRF